MASHDDDDSIFDFSVDEAEEIDSGGSGGSAAAMETSTADLLAMGDEVSKIKEKIKEGTATAAHKSKFKHLCSAIKKEAAIKATATAARKGTMATKTKELHKLVAKRHVTAVLRDIVKSEQVDLAFVIDATYSMDPHIAAVKGQVDTVVQRVRSTNPQLKLRVACVAYRDLCDGADRVQARDFSEDIGAFKSFMGGVAPQGGGDPCEDVAAGLQRANTLDWRAQTRVLFLIADAPCHGSRFHNLGSGNDHYHDGGTPGIDVLAELKALADKGIGLNFGRITEHTDKMTAQFAAHIAPAKLAQVEMPRGTGKPADVVRVGEMLTKAVTGSVRDRIHETRTACLAKTGAVTFAPALESLLEEAGGGGGGTGTSEAPSLKSYTLDTATVNFASLGFMPVKVLTHKPPSNIRELCEGRGPLRLFAGRGVATTTSRDIQIKIAPRPFAEGACRLAYHGQVQMGGITKPMVFKEFKHDGAGVHDLVQYKGQIEVSTIACYLARVYNRTTKAAGALPVEYLNAHMVNVSRGGTHSSGAAQYHCMENALPAGEFTKWSNNYGGWAYDKTTAECKTLAEFSLFTYKATDGFLMVVDLQGVLAAAEGGKPRRFVLTDPVILCKDLTRYGNTNLGRPEIFKRCFDCAKRAISATPA